MRLVLTIFLASVLCTVSSRAQSLQLIDDLPSDFKENSGIEYYGNGILYFIMDGGNPNHLYRYDTASKSYTEKVVANATNVDWEDIAQDNAGNLFIGDFGNNSNDRTNLVIYKTQNPEAAGDTLNAQKIEFTFENQTSFPPASSALNFDCEAIAWYNDSLYLFSKNRTDPYTGYTYMYILPDQPGNYTAMLVDSFNTGQTSKESGWITAADIDSGRLVLLSSGKFWLFPDFDKTGLAIAIEADLANFSQKEAICFADDQFRSFFISDEEFFGIGNRLFYYNFIVLNSPYIAPSKLNAMYSEGMLNLVNAEPGADVIIASNQGRIVLQYRIYPHQGIDVRHLSNSVYHIYVKGDKNVHYIKWFKTE